MTSLFQFRRLCHHKNIVEATNGRDDRWDDRLTHWLCRDCGRRFPLIGDTDQWNPARLSRPLPCRFGLHHWVKHVRTTGRYHGVLSTERCDRCGAVR